MRLNVDYKDLDDLLEKYQDSLPPDEKLTRIDVKMFKNIFFGLAEINNGGWTSVKDDLPKEHPSMFYELYGTEKWNRFMWRTESDRVLVAIKFPDGTRTVDKGKLQDGVWRTGVSPALLYEVTHWALWPESPKENET